MKTALLCWEHGGGLGHIVMLQRIGTALQSRGIRCVAALDSRYADHMLDGIVDEIIQAPPRDFGEDQPPRTQVSDTIRILCNTTGTLWRAGFWRVASIAQKIHAWHKVFAIVKPDIIIADLAPFAMLAASQRIATVSTGVGFFVPALLNGYFTPDGDPCCAEDRVAQDLTFNYTTEAFHSIGISPPNNIGMALRGDYPCPSCLPALDPRYKIRETLLVPPDMDSLPVEAKGGKEIFIYLGSDIEQHLGVLEAFSITGLSGTLYAGAAKESALEKLPSTIRVRRTPFTANELSERCGLVVHHGGPGLTQLAAAVGIPQLAAYLIYERWSNTQAIWRMGSGTGLAIGTEDFNRFPDLLKTYSEDGQHREAARKWGETSRAWIAGRRGQDVIADRVMETLR